MIEYIEREAVLNDMPGIGRFGEEYDKGVIDCRDYVWRFPAADVAPVIHAHVVVNWLGDCKCSNCGDYCDATKLFCASCGARFDEPEMREE